MGGAFFGRGPSKPGGWETWAPFGHFFRLLGQGTFLGGGPYWGRRKGIPLAFMVAWMFMGMGGLAPFDGAGFGMAQLEIQHAIRSNA